MVHANGMYCNSTVLHLVYHLIVLLYVTIQYFICVMSVLFSIQSRDGMYDDVVIVRSNLSSNSSIDPASKTAVRETNS